MDVTPDEILSHREARSTEELSTFVRTHDRSRPLREDCPVIVAQFGGKEWLLDGTTRINLWVRKGNQESHPVNVHIIGDKSAEKVDIGDIITYWRDQQQTDAGKWLHPDDVETFRSHHHSFNLEYPVSPYVGDISNAPVIILGANAGYRKDRTPTEFPDQAAMQRYLDRVRNPATADWSGMAKYYHGTNYGPLLLEGKAAWINACAYRSPRLSQEPQNRRLIRTLPSAQFTRRWLLEAVMPFAERGERLVVAKRFGQWKLPPELKDGPGIVFDPAPVSPQVTSEPWAAVQNFLKGRYQVE